MEEKIEQIKKLTADFRLLATKVEKDNQIGSKNSEETNQVLEACKKISKTESTKRNLKKIHLVNNKNCSNVKTSLKITLRLT